MRKQLLVVSLALASLIVVACGGDTPASTTSAATTFVLDEWSIVPPKNLPAGKVAITATNNGKETHELVIVRAADVSSLPTKSDGSVNEDQIPESRKVGEIADLAAGKTETKTLDVPAGDYVAFCNIVEDMGNGSGMGSDTHMGGDAGMRHVHYTLGMVTAFTAA